MFLDWGKEIKRGSRVREIENCWRKRRKMVCRIEGMNLVGVWRGIGKEKGERGGVKVKKWRVYLVSWRKIKRSRKKEERRRRKI